MRDYFIIVIVAFICLSALRNPLYGLYGWLLVSFMNIQRLGWGMASNLRLGAIAAAATIMGSILHPKSFVSPTRESVLFFCFWLFTTLTTELAIHPDVAWQTWGIFSKIALFYFLTIYLVRDFDSLKRVLIVAVLCLGLYGVKGGLFSILTGGSYRVYGPDDSSIADNNDLALALNMTLPLLVWLAQNSAKKWHSSGWYALLVLSMVSIIFTFSRGGLITLVFVAICLAWSSGKRIQVFSVLVIGGLLAASYIGQQWISRMQTVASYREESSAASRLMAWRVATDFALDHPLTGGGFGAMNRDVYKSRGIDAGIVSHSIYFGTLAEQGFPGLTLYLLVFASAFLSLRYCRKKSSERLICDFSKMLRISLLAFMLGGAFYERQYFDYAFFLISLVSITKIIVKKEMQEKRDSVVISEIPAPSAVPITVSPGV